MSKPDDCTHTHASCRTYIRLRQTQLSACLYFVVICPAQIRGSKQEDNRLDYWPDALCSLGGCQFFSFFPFFRAGLRKSSLLALCLTSLTRHSTCQVTLDRSLGLDAVVIARSFLALALIRSLFSLQRSHQLYKHPAGPYFFIFFFFFFSSA